MGLDNFLLLRSIKEKILFDQLSYKDYKLIRRSNLIKIDPTQKNYAISCRILSNKLTLKLLNSLIQFVYRNPACIARETTNRKKFKSDTNFSSKTETRIQFGLPELDLCKLVDWPIKLVDWQASGPASIFLLNLRLINCSVDQSTGRSNRSTCTKLFPSPYQARARVLFLWLPTEFEKSNCVRKLKLTNYIFSHIILHLGEDFSNLS